MKMPLEKQFHSLHLAALKREIKLKFNCELYSTIEKHSELRKVLQYIFYCLNRGIVPVDILRNTIFNPVLDGKLNFYVLNLNIFHVDSAKILNDSSRIHKYLMMSKDMMSNKDMWKLFLLTTLLELQGEDKGAIKMFVGSDQKIGEEEAEFVVRGLYDAPRLIVVIGGGEWAFNERKMKGMMTKVLISNYNNHRHWPLPELVHLSVYGIIALGNDFHIYRMTLNAEKGTKMALLFTRGKRDLPTNLFSLKQEKEEEIIVSVSESESESKCSCVNGPDSYCDCAFESHSEFGSSFISEYNSSDFDSNATDEWSNYTDSDLCEDFEELDMNGDVIEQPARVSRTDVLNIAVSDPADADLVVVYKKPNKGSVAAVIGLIQTILEQDKSIRIKNKKFRQRQRNLKQRARKSGRIVIEREMI